MVWEGGTIFAKVWHLDCLIYVISSQFFIHVVWDKTELIWDSSRLIYVRKQFPRIVGLHSCVECKVSWSNCPCGKTLPGFSPRSVLGHPSLARLSSGVYLAHKPVHFSCWRSGWNIFFSLVCLACEHVRFRGINCVEQRAHSVFFPLL